MKWFIDEPIEAQVHQIQHGEPCLFLGSCFSENIVEKGRGAGLHFQNSAFGTLFHPIPMARVLQDAVLLNSVERVIERADRFYTWDAFTKFNADSKIELNQSVQKERNSINEQLKEAKFLFLTFGTAFGYTNREGLLVANCHKMPAADFTSELSDVGQMRAMYSDVFAQIKQLNPQINIVLTVSPVRHSKDGLVTNNRSKARLLRLCEELEKLEGVNYFPAYEMVLDELRDYRFYGSDLVHPNEMAVKYVWEKFQTAFFSQETIQLNKEVEKRRAFFNHVPNAKENQQEKDLRDKKQNELNIFLADHPEIIWK